MANFVLWRGNDNRLVGEGLSTIVLATGASLFLDASATVAVTLIDATTQVAIDGEDWPLALTYIVGSAGNFHGVLRDTLVLAEYQQVLAQVSIDNGADQHGALVLPCVVQVRRG